MSTISAKNPAPFAAISSLGRLDLVKGLDIKKGDVLVVASTGIPEGDAGVSESLGISKVIPEAELVGLCLGSRLGAHVAFMLSNKYDEVEIPEVPFKFDTPLTVVETLTDKERHLDLLVEDPEGNQFNIYSGMLQIDGSTINGFSVADVAEALAAKARGGLN